VLQSLRDLCSRRGWVLWAGHVRINHIHVVATADCKPEQVMMAMKAYGSYALNRHGLDQPHRRWWARHGSTRYFWPEDAVKAAIQYVVGERGVPWQYSTCLPLANAQGSVSQNRTVRERTGTLRRGALRAR
jgi:hypothetical protein